MVPMCREGMTPVKKKGHSRLRLAGFGLLASAMVTRRHRLGLGFLGALAVVGSWFWRRVETPLPPSALLAKQSLPPGSHIVEIGAGEFPWLAALGRLGPDLTVHAVSGTVPAAPAVWQQTVRDHIRHLQAHTHFDPLAADARTLPLGDRSAQLVVVHGVLDRFLSREGRRQVIADAVRILKPGGRLLIGEPQFLSEAAAAMTEAGLSVTAEHPPWLVGAKAWG
jgi:SAM-dependent methyltransferase